jgi:serine protease Do
MKKIVLTLLFVLTLGLTACSPIIDDNDDDSVTVSYTEEELKALIEELLPEVSVDTTYDLASFESAVTSMIAEARGGVIGIVNTMATGTTSGSGVVYKQDGNDYYVVTNQHVVEASVELTVVYEENGLLFEIDDVVKLGEDVTTDLAVIKFTSTKDFTVIPLADSYDLEVGQFVFAIGNPLGFDYYGTVTMGVISGTARYVQESTGFDATLLQHDASISPGNSGGALVNTNGELVGINNMKIVDDDVSDIGFAIPSNTVKRIIEDLEDDGEVTRPYLGISTYAQVNACGLDYGVCVTVQSGGAADNAGLQNDDVIIGYKNDGMDDFLNIYNFNDLKEAILNSSVGETITLKYVRNGLEYISEETVLGSHPDD